MASPTTKALRCAPWTAAQKAPSVETALSSSSIPDELFMASNIQQLINEKCAELATPWNGSVVFPVYPVHDKKDNLQEVFSKAPVAQDICSFLNGAKSLSGNNKLYFCPTTYPPPCKGDTDDEKELKFNSINVDLQRAAKDCGSPIVIGKGGGQARPGTHIYQCDYCYRAASKSQAKPGMSHRVTNLTNNDRSGRRQGVGKSGSKRVNVTDKSIVCPFNFTVKSDEHGFFVTIIQQAGNAGHIGHPLFDPDTSPDSTRLLTQEEKDDAKFVMDATRNKAVGRNFLKAKYDKHLSYAKLVYLDSLGKDDVEDEYESLFTMLEKSEEVRYNILWSCPPKCNGDRIETVSTTRIGDDVDHFDISEAPELAAVAAKVEDERKGQNISRDNQVFHSISWSNEKVFRYFKLNPEVVTCDITSHTNRSGYHLLTFSVRTAIDKQVVFLRIWLPDQTRSSFRYVFQEALTKLIPEHIRQKVMFFMKDGDPQQEKELIQSIQTNFTNAIDGGCGYHIVNMGWNRHVKGCDCVPAKNLDLWKKIIQGMHKWMYTWMRPGYCEDEEEYKISKQLLLQFVSSRYVRNVTGENDVLIKNILNFIRNNVFVKENQYLHFRRRDVRTLEVSHSSAHEGTNYGLKSHAAAVQPTMTLNNAAAAMGIQDDTKAAECDFIVHRDFRNSNKAWSPWPTAPYLTTYGEGVLMQAYARSSLYRVRRVGKYSFQVVYVGEGCDEEFVKLFFDGVDDDLDSRNDNSSDTSIDIVDGSEAKAASVMGNSNCDIDEGTEVPKDNSASTIVGGDNDGFDISDCAVPLYNRAHLVTLGKESKCSCCRHERIGMFCPHVVCCANEVCGKLGKRFDGFTHHSVAVRWWSSYMYYGYKQPKNHVEIELVQLFHAQSLNDTKGPCFDDCIPNTMDILAPIPDMPAIDRLKNYPKEAVPSMNKFDGIFSCTHNPNSYQDYEDHILSDEAVLQTLNSLNTASVDQIFENSVSNVIGAHRPGVGTRNVLYPLWNQITNAHDQLKNEDWDKEFEKILQDHLTKTNAKLREADSNDKKRKIVPITAERYKGTAKRSYNTKKHPF